MAKLRLDPERLTVETFRPEAAAGEGGTVAAHQGRETFTCPPYTANLADPTCDPAVCGGGSGNCGTWAVTCQGTTCNGAVTCGTCQITCNPTVDDGRCCAF